MVRSWPRAILHVDADAFFASCEQATHPEYRGKPVVTGKERGIVSAASYEAKARGISRGVALWDVKKICPEAIIVPSDYETYSIFSERMFAIVRRFTSTVEEYSIDEAFADITGLRRPLNGSYEDICIRIKETIERELGITVSIGLSVSKVLAKIGSKWNKPSGFTAISGRNISDYLRKLTVDKVWGIGPATTAYCAKLGISTALDFASKDEAFINKHFAKPQYELWRELNGDSVMPIETEEKSTYASISKTRTFTPPSSDRAFVFAQLLKNAENACIKARRHGLLARGISVFLKTQEFRYASVEASFSRPTAYPTEMTESLQQAFRELYDSRLRYRATGIVLMDLVPEDGAQLDLFEKPLRMEKMRRLYDAVDALAAMMGKHCVHSAGSLLAHRESQHAAERGDTTWRKTARLPGETLRRHLSIPVLAGDVL